MSHRLPFHNPYQAGKTTLAYNLMKAFKENQYKGETEKKREREREGEGEEEEEEMKRRDEMFLMSTVGIDIHECMVQDKNEQSVSLKLWDFAGQKLYHSVHEVFFSFNALYLLVWDVTIG